MTGAQSWFGEQDQRGTALALEHLDAAGSVGLLSDTILGTKPDSCCGEDCCRS